jgi:aminoglycoside 3-N-acetyltransferase I
MRALNRVFGEAFAEPATYRDDPPSDAYLRDMLGKDHIIVLTVGVGAEVVGGLVAYELDKFERARREVYIYDLAIAAPNRRRGLATALIRRLQEIAASRGAWVIFVQADYGDDPAIALYRRIGAQEEVLHFDVPVPGA